MKSKRLLTAAVAGAMVALVGCDQGDDVNVTIGSGGTGGGTTVQPPTNCPAFALPVVVSNRALCQISGLIAEDRTLTSNIDWFLNGSVRVGNGDLELAGGINDPDLDRAVLTIEPGTDIFASGDSLLKITRGSRIEAAGTPAAPITFSGVDEGFEGSGEWGAVIVQGFAVTNVNQAAGDINVDLEAGLGFYGGNDDDDNSGTMTYVRIAETGVEIAPNEEINGLTLAGVGRGTTINHIQLKGGLDDGIEWFGGTANVSHVVMTEIEDDSLDMDLGYRGNVQFVIIQRNAASDHAIESDNLGSNFNALPRSQPVLANMTMLGDGRGPVAKHREGFAASVFNSLYDEDVSCLDVDSQADEIVSGALVYVNVFFDCAADTVGDNDDCAGNEFAEQIATNLFNNDVTTGTPFTVNTTTFIPAGITATLPAAAAISSEPTADATFIVDTDFVGAVDPDGSDPWFDGWLLPGTF